MYAGISKPKSPRGLGKDKQFPYTGTGPSSESIDGRCVFKLVLTDVGVLSRTQFKSSHDSVVPRSIKG